MARNVEIITANNGSALVSAVDTFLATLTDPLIHGLAVEFQDQVRVIGKEFCATISYDDGAGGTLANPFTLAMLSASNVADLQTAYNDLVTGAPAEYFLPLGTICEQRAGRIVQFWLPVLRNALAAADANVSFP